MPSTDNIANQQQLLQAHRRTLTHLLQQAAAYGGVSFVPAATASGITEARVSIAKCKAILRSWAATVDDLPDDNESLPTSPTRLSPGDAGIPYARPIFNFYGL
jgi:hypothetical protein